MTKVKLKDATRELLKNTEGVLASVFSLRKNAEQIVDIAKGYENKYQKEEEERRAKEKLAEQQRLSSQHTKAYTMPDTDDAEIQPVPAPAASEVPVAPIKTKQVDQAAPSAEVKKPEKEVHSEQSASKAVKPKATVDEEHAASENAKQSSKADVQPKAKKEEPSEPAPFARPRVETEKSAEVSVEQPKPVQPSNVNQRPARPVNQVAQQHTQPQNAANRPANPQQGMNGRSPAPQQNAGAQMNNRRPAPNGQQYGRPVNPQGQQYGRPANPQGQQYGRPVQAGQNMPARQGPYGRPVNPQGQQYGRPANQGGPYGRPVNPQGQQYGRPVQPGMHSRSENGSASQGGQRTGGMQSRPQGMQQRKQPMLDMTPTVEKERVSNYDPNKKNYDRQHDPEHVAKNRKQLARENHFGSMDDDTVRGGRKSRTKKQPSAQQLMAPIKIENATMTAETITVRDLTERIGKPAGEILKALLILGNMATINSELDYDTASLVCSELGVELELNIKKNAEDKLADLSAEAEDDDELQPRPPVVTIMGHVDHGKTSLLDYIRKAHVTAGEAGGITQHIGAYTAEINGRSITFLDTPGHEAFTAMRARGAQATDVAVLVVAADDGVMPQTVEAIKHAKAANVPIVVAINKMDKPTANPDRVKQDLTNYELVCEEWGGETIMVPVSAVTGDGVDNLLEMILLQADILELKANPNRMAKGVIIEAKLDKSRGPMATVLLQSGTLHVGDNIVAGLSSGRVRAMMNDKGERVTEAGPSTPVEITGFTDVPSAGDDMMAVADDHLGRQVVQERRDKLKAARVNASTKVSLDNLFSRIDQSKQTTLNVIVKADVQGSVEAVKAALEKLSSDEVKVRVLFAAVGGVTKDDVNLASASDAIIIGFNIRPDSSAAEAAKREGVDIRLYRVIYQAIEDIEKAMKGLLDPEYKEVLLGHAEVRNTFHITGAGTVAGCYVKDGKMQRNAECRLIRDNVVVREGKLNSLKRFKDDAKEVAEGYECGISFDGYNDIKEGDIIECYIMEEIER